MTFSAWMGFPLLMSVNGILWSIMRSTCLYSAHRLSRVLDPASKLASWESWQAFDLARLLIWPVFSYGPSFDLARLLVWPVFFYLAYLSLASRGVNGALIQVRRGSKYRNIF